MVESAEMEYRKGSQCMKFTQSNGNAQNGIQGSRVRVWAEHDGGKPELMGEVTIPVRGALLYCSRHPSGSYGRKFVQLCLMAAERERSVMEDENHQQEEAIHE